MIGQTLRGVTMKKMLCGRNNMPNSNDANLEMFCHIFLAQALHMPRSKNIPGIYRPKYKYLATSRLYPSPPIRFTSRCGTDKARWWVLEPPLEDGARRKRFDRYIPVSRIPYRGRDEKTPWLIPVLSKTRLILYIDITYWYYAIL